MEGLFCSPYAWPHADSNSLVYLQAHLCSLWLSKPWWKSNSSRCGLRERIALPFSFGVRSEALAHKYTVFGRIRMQPRVEILNIYVHSYSVQYFMLPHNFKMTFPLLSCGIYKLISLLNLFWQVLTSALFYFYGLHTRFVCFACKLIQTQHDYHIFHIWLPNHGPTKKKKKQSL